MNQVNGDDDDNGGDDYGNGFGSYDEEPLTKRVFTGQWMLPTIALEIVTDVTLSFNESLSPPTFSTSSPSQRWYSWLFQFDKQGPFIQDQSHILATYGCQGIRIKG